MDNYDVKTIRESMRMTQEQFADLLGVSVRTIGDWESGASIPATKIKSLKAILAKPIRQQFSGGGDAVQIGGDINGNGNGNITKPDAGIITALLNTQTQLTKSQEQIDRLITVIEHMTPGLK